MNDSTAKLLIEENIFPNGGNCPTIHKEYLCPCGQGKIIEERVSGFHDLTVTIDCPSCQSKYDLVTGCGHIWELRLRLPRYIRKK